MIGKPLIKELVMDREIRKRKVLDIILRTHIDRAMPIGSTYIAELMGLSSATIRNTMSDLYDEGYLEQPHTSAGRVPTERAYRLYVNSLLEQFDSNTTEIKKISRELLSRRQRYNDIIMRISYSVSKLTGYTTFAVYPTDHIYMDGTYHILEQPEFYNLKKIKKILGILDEKERFLSLINSYLSTGSLKIHIGRENNLPGFEVCSLITASYNIRGRVVGGLGIVGPIRMKYRRVIPVVRYCADSISRMLEGVYER